MSVYICSNEKPSLFVSLSSLDLVQGCSEGGKGDGRKEMTGKDGTESMRNAMLDSLSVMISEKKKLNNAR